MSLKKLLQPGLIWKPPVFTEWERKRSIRESLWVEEMEKEMRWALGLSRMSKDIYKPLSLYPRGSSKQCHPLNIFGAQKWHEPTPPPTTPPIHHPHRHKPTNLQLQLNWSQRMTWKQWDEEEISRFPKLSSFWKFCKIQRVIILACIAFLILERELFRKNASHWHKCFPPRAEQKMIWWVQCQASLSQHETVQVASSTPQEAVICDSAGRSSALILLHQVSIMSV